MDVSKDSSSSAETYDYDVFLSFDGRRRALADKLYGSLKHEGIRVFKGEELGRGEDIASSLCRPIRRSRISIPIISDDYARNARCLDEVVQMLECRENQGQRIFPVYHVVDPHDIRNQMSPFSYIFTEHERGGIDLDRIEIWKKSLRQLASLKGWEVPFLLINDGDVEHIISDVRQILKEDSSSVTMDVSGCSSSVEKIRDYDVFLNFGLDFERGFADLLYCRLMDAGVLVVRGEDVPVGEQIVDFVPQVMKRSKICIPVFSRGYAKSRWFLDEVAGMAECRKSKGHRIFPIYYQTDPYDNPYDIRSIHFYESVNPDRMEIWKRALRDVASLKIWKIDRWSGYDEHIKHIVSHVLQSLREDITSTTMDVPVCSSLVKGTYHYDVFLSFGSDIERDFADPLYSRLKGAKILVCRGEDTPVGEEIASFALKVMNRSKISIPVFSKGYAGSKQCLDEVVGMLERKKNQGHRVFPIYYRIDPQDIRNQIHDKEVDPGRIEIWERALREVTSLKGWELDEGFSKDRHVEHIISHVLQSLKEDSSSVTMDISGCSSSVEKIRGYDVFLNFGPDVEGDFADLLYSRIMDAGVLVVRGEDVPVGEQIVDFVPQAMKRSKICIPIFSGGYAASKWFLDEIAGMAECRKSKGHRVFPVFYRIDSEDIGSINFYERVNPGRMGIWKRALREVASLKGWKIGQG